MDRFGLHSFVATDAIHLLVTDDGIAPATVAEWAAAGVPVRTVRPLDARVGRRPAAGHGSPKGNRMNGRAARTVAAVDLGAESGRVTAVSFDGSTLDLHLVEPFPARTIAVGRAAALGHRRPVGVDRRRSRPAGRRPARRSPRSAWTPGASTTGSSTPTGALVDRPVSYRDDRNVAALQVALDEVGAAALYDSTGVQIIPINSIFGLLADVRTAPDRLAAAERLLMMPDVFHHLLSGTMVTEYTAASTSAAYDMAGNRWATELLDRLGIPTRILPEVVPPGTDVGAITGVPTSGALAGARVIVPPGHDTASAVVAIPFADPGALFISSGTWSLVGVETEAAVINAGSRRANLTNEGGYAGTIRLLRNVMGLWVLQQCRRQWAAEGKELSYPEIADLAAAEPGLVSVVDLDDELFLAPGDMPRRIREYCARNGSPVPQSIGAIGPMRRRLAGAGLSRRRRRHRRGHRTTAPPSVSIVGGGAEPHPAVPVDRRRHRPGRPLRSGRGQRAGQRRRPARGAR